MYKKAKLWFKILTTTILLTGGLTWSGDKVLAAEGDVEINETNFPDYGFREYIAMCFDSDGNGILSQDEIDKVVTIYPNQEGYEVEQCKGIEFFPNLQVLNCGGNSNMRELDVTKNSNLVSLNCGGTTIGELDLKNNPKLERLECMDSAIRGLDLSQNTNLKYLDCSNNWIGALDVSLNPNLVSLICDSTSISQLDLTNNTNLVGVSCNCSQLKLGNNPNLSSIVCVNEELSMLDLSGCAYFYEIGEMKQEYNSETFNYINTFKDENRYLKISANTNVITGKMIEGAMGEATIDAAHFPDEQFRNYVKSFDVIDCDGCLSISELVLVNSINIVSEMGDPQVESTKGIEYFFNLQSLSCTSDDLKEIDLSQNKNLKTLQLGCKKMKNIDLSQNTELEEIDLSTTKLAGLDLTNNTKLKKVSFWTYSCIVDLSNHPALESVHQEGLTSYLNLEGDTALTDIILTDSDLAKINIKGCTSLRNLNFTGSALTELDLTGCENILALSLTMPKLQKLYAGPKSQLKKLYIRNSEQLTNIDLSDAAKMESFTCESCPLVEKLTISKAAPLKEFNCYITALREIDLSPYASLGTIRINGNSTLTKVLLPSQIQMGELDISGNIGLTEVQFPTSGKIRQINFNENGIENIDLSTLEDIPKVVIQENPSLKTIALPTQSKTIYISKNASLESVSIATQIRNLDILNNKKLSEVKFPQGCTLGYLVFNGNGTEKVDVSECHELELAEITNNDALKSIVFPSSDYLESISCKQNGSLQSIDVSKCKYLLYLHCGENALQSLDLQENINLRQLDCNNNQLKELIMPKDISYDILSSGEEGKEKSTLVVNSLKDLNCSSNQLKDLELSDCEALTHLDCTKNQIKRIDISTCDELLKRVTGAKKEINGQMNYVDGIDGGYCLTCDSNVRVIIHGTVDEIFDDVVKEEWYKDAVQFAYDKKIMNGVSEEAFAPKMTLTREQFITVLYNMEGAPEIALKDIFDDVKNEPNVWYAKPVTWAFENKITSGVGNGLFGTGNEITREQLATLLYNYAGKKDEFKLTINGNAIANFPDAGQISTWASDGMKWAVTNGVMGGKTGKDGQNILDPKGKATRAECAQMIKNLKEKAVK